MARLKSMPSRFGRSPRRVPQLPKKADSFYQSREWRALLKQIKQERGRYCERCGAGGSDTRLIGDHIKEIRDGGAKLDPRNVMLLCIACHNRKTADAKRARVGGGRSIPQNSRDS